MQNQDFPQGSGTSVLPDDSAIKGARILVVDDSPDMRMLMETLLVRNEFKVTTAQNGRECIESAQRFHPDLILMDVQMPEMDGYEATRILKADPNLAAIPVIILTARSATESKLEGLQQGADDYISKPFDRRELLVRVSSLLRISAYRRLLAERNRRIEAELDMARLLQQKLLPAELPEVAGLTIQARYIPMDKVGGDFFDTHVDEDGNLGLFLADVSGHGIPAAFFSAIAKMAFHFNRHLSAEPAGVLHAINEAVLQFSVQSIFLTALFARINPRERRIRFSLAGQCRPLLHRRTTGEIIEIAAPGAPIGLIEKLPLEERSMDLEARDRIVFFTDGVTELKNDLTLFDDQKLGEFLKGHGDTPADELADRLIRHVRDLEESETLSDDLTLVIVDLD